MVAMRSKQGCILKADAIRGTRSNLRGWMVPVCNWRLRVKTLPYFFSFRVEGGNVRRESFG